LELLGLAQHRAHGMILTAQSLGYDDERPAIERLNQGEIPAIRGHRYAFDM
jgi:hypothetical protein